MRYVTLYINRPQKGSFEGAVPQKLGLFEVETGSEIAPRVFEHLGIPLFTVPAHQVDLRVSRGIRIRFNAEAHVLVTPENRKQGQGWIQWIRFNPMVHFTESVRYGKVVDYFDHDTWGLHQR